MWVLIDQTQASSGRSLEIHSHNYTVVTVVISLSYLASRSLTSRPLLCYLTARRSLARYISPKHPLPQQSVPPTNSPRQHPHHWQPTAKYSAPRRDTPRIHQPTDSLTLTNPLLTHHIHIRNSSEPRHATPHRNDTPFPFPNQAASS